MSLAFAQGPEIGSDLLSQLHYRYIGPVGNRVIAAASIPGDPNVYYAGAASGGAFSRKNRNPSTSGYSRKKFSSETSSSL